MPSTNWEEEFLIKSKNGTFFYNNSTGGMTIRVDILKDFISSLIASERSKLLEEIESQEAKGYEAENILESIKNNLRFN